MALSPQEREQIYREEKALRKTGVFSPTAQALALATITAAAGLTLLFVLARTKPRRSLRIADLRAAYNGLAPEDY